MRALTFAAFLALTGCSTGMVNAPVATPPAGAAPQKAILYRDTVTVQFSDGALCVAPRPGAARSWSGRLSGCPHLLAYDVTLPPGPLAPRRVLVRLEGGGVRVIEVETVAFGLSGPV